MSFKKAEIPVLFLLALLCLACSNKSQVLVPKPEAWPRIELYPQSYSPIPEAPLRFLVNDSTTALHTENPLWFSRLYPRYNATLFITFTKVSPDDRDQIIDNRLERMALNAGPSESTLTDLTSEGGFKAQMMLTPRATVTPLQFIAVSDNWVVSGAVAFDNIQQPDSLAPVLQALENDILEALKHLQPY